MDLLNKIDFIKFNFIYIDKYFFSTNWVYPKEKIGYGLLRYILSGKAIFTINGTPYTVKENQVIYIQNGSYLECKSLSDNLSFYSIRFSCSADFKNYDILTAHFKINTVSKCYNTEIENYFSNIYECILKNSKSKMFKARGYLELIIAFLIENGKVYDSIPQSEKPLENNLNFSQSSSIDYRIQSIIDYIILHNTEKHSVKKMCKMANLSESHFRKLFKTHTGKTPIQFLTDCRILTASRTLLISNKSINEISYELGFEDPNYFIRVFKKNFGQTPAKYRSQIKNC